MLQSISPASFPLLLFPVRIGFTQTAHTVSEVESGVPLTLRVLEGAIAPELGDILVTVSTNDNTASGELPPFFFPSLSADNSDKDFDSS